MGPLASKDEEDQNGPPRQYISDEGEMPPIGQILGPMSLHREEDQRSSYIYTQMKNQ